MCPGVELLDHIATLFLDFRGTTISFSIMAALIYISQNSVGGFPFLETLVLISKVYNVSSFREDLFSQVTGSSGPDTPSPEVRNLVSETPRFCRRAQWSGMRCTTLPLWGFGWPKTPRDTFTPPQKMSLTCSMQQFAFSTSFLVSPVDHSVLALPLGGPE